MGSASFGDRVLGSGAAGCHAATLMVGSQSPNAPAVFGGVGYCLKICQAPLSCYAIFVTGEDLVCMLVGDKVGDG